MITLFDEIKELERELRTRQGVYPNWISSRKITKEVAAHRLACLESTIKRLREAEPVQTKLFE